MTTTANEVHDVNWHKLNPKRMPIILRDLAPLNPFNPLNLWPDEEETLKRSKKSDTENLSEQVQDFKVSRKGGKSKKPKKADLIRAQVAKELAMKKNKQDEEKLSNSKTVSLMKMKMVTPIGRLKQLFEILKDFYKKKQYLDAIDTYWEIEAVMSKHRSEQADVTGDTTNVKKKGKSDKKSSKKKVVEAENTFIGEMAELLKKNKKYWKKVEDILEPKDLTEFQLTEMSDRLPPLNLHHMKTFVLDPWQRQVLQNIDVQQSMIVCAPTSSGKTVLSSYVSIVGGNVLFVVPSPPLAWQVAALFHSLLKGRVALITKGVVYLPEDYRIVVGTPFAIEEALLDIGYDFQYAVYDEVHDLNGEEGESLERIIKGIQCPFLALSATIGNANVLKDWWTKVYGKEIKLMEYSGRFINLQRMIWLEDDFEALHPCACITMDYLVSQGGFASGDLAFTPKDSYALWQAFLKYYPRDLVEDVNPVAFFENFKTLRITLLQSKDYEGVVKTKLESLAKSHPKETEELLTSFAPKIDENPNDKVRLWPIVQKLSNAQLIPAIGFQLDAVRCRQLFDELLSDIEDAEKAKYPNYRLNLEKELEAFEKSNKRKEASASKAKQKEEDERDAQEFNEVAPPDVYCPHPDFVLTPVGFRLSAAEFKEIKYVLSYDLAGSSEAGHALIRSLRRGIGLYIQRLPDAYLRIVQSLAQSGRLALVLSDDSLAYGVNMPFRTCVFAEDTGEDILTSLMVQQMAGRAGRRGLDRQGNLVFAGMKWSRIQTLMRGLLPDVVGKPTLYPTISLQAYISPVITPEDVHRISTNSLYDYVGKSDVGEEYLKHSIEWMESFDILKPKESKHITEGATEMESLLNAHTLNVDKKVAHFIWQFRDDPIESLCIYSILDTLYDAFHHKKGDQIGLQMALFNMLLRVVDRHSYDPALAHCSELSPISGLEAEWETISSILEDYQNKVSTIAQLRLPIPHLNKLDGYVMQTLIDNRIPNNLATQQLNTLKKRLWHVGDRLRILHNVLNSCRKYMELEEIIRKCFRRIKWILIDSEV